MLQPVPVQRHDVRDGRAGLLRFSAPYGCQTGQQQVLRAAGAQDQIAGPPYKISWDCPFKLLQPVPVQRHDVRDGGPGLLRFSAPPGCHTGQQQVLRAAGALEDQIAGPRGLQRDVVYLGWPIAPSYMSPNAGEMSLSQWAQLYTGAQINFGDLTPYLTYGRTPPICTSHFNVLKLYVMIKTRKISFYCWQNVPYNVSRLEHMHSTVCKKYFKWPKTCTKVNMWMRSGRVWMRSSRVVDEI